MSKSLSELIEASNPNQHLPSSQFVDVASYDRMKRVAIELAKACEHIHSKKPRCEGCVSVEVSLSEHYDYVAEQTLTQARKILGDE